MTDVLGIIWWDDDGVRKYRCCGTGEKYQKFYREFVPNSSYRCTSTDFPWDFFVFDNPQDHERLISAFPGDVSKDID
jgi:hypothetical protein